MTDHQGLLTQADYARHRGVTRQAVGKAVRLKKIPVHIINGRKLIDRAEADFALGINIARLLNEEPIEQNVVTNAVKSSDGLTAARTENERYKTKMLELMYRQRLGELVEVADLVSAAEVCCHTLVDIFDQLPERVDEILLAASAGGNFAARRKMKEITYGSRKQIIETFAKLAKDATTPDENTQLTKIEDLLDAEDQ